MSKHNEIMSEICEKIAGKVASDGHSMKSAFNSVFGDGAYEKFVDELYESLRIQAALTK